MKALVGNHRGSRQQGGIRRRALDSGASGHMTGEEAMLRGLVRRVHIPVNGIEGEGGGMVATGVAAYAESNDLRLNDMHFVPGMETTLVSVSQLVEDHHKVVAELVGGRNMMTVSKDGEVVVELGSCGEWNVLSARAGRAGAHAGSGCGVGG